MHSHDTPFLRLAAALARSSNSHEKTCPRTRSCASGILLRLLQQPTPTTPSKPRSRLPLFGKQLLDSERGAPCLKDCLPCCAILRKPVRPGSGRRSASASSAISSGPMATGELQTAHSLPSYHPSIAPLQLTGQQFGRVAPAPVPCRPAEGCKEIRSNNLNPAINLRGRTRALPSTPRSRGNDRDCGHPSGLFGGKAPVTAA